MFSVPRLLTGPETLLLAAVGALLGVFVSARLVRGGPSRVRAASAIAAALVASSLAVAPITAWAIVSDIRAAHRLTDRESARLGPEQNAVDTVLTDRVASLIPPDQTYSLVFADSVEPNRALAFRLWSLTALIPRVAQTDPGSAEWVVSWGLRPRDLDVDVVNVRRLELPAGDDPPVYVGRVVK